MAEIQNAYASCREMLLARPSEPAPARIQLLTGPRQVGKTTLLLETAARFGDQALWGYGNDSVQNGPFGDLSVLQEAANGGLADVQPSCDLRLESLACGERSRDGKHDGALANAALA
jgi:hypothetical protein